MNEKEKESKYIIQYYTDNVEKLPLVFKKLLNKLLVGEVDLCLTDNQIIQRLVLSKDGKIDHLRIKYIESKDVTLYEIINNDNCNRINRQINDHYQGIAFGYRSDGIKYLYEWIDSKRYGPVIHFTKPLRRLMSIRSFSRCANDCQCIYCKIERFPEQIYTFNMWFLFDIRVTEKVFRKYLKKQREKLKKYKNFLLPDLRKIIIEYLGVNEYSNEFPNHYLPDATIEEIEKEYDKLNLK